MKRALAPFLAVAIHLALTAPGGAHEIKFGQLVISHPWIKQSQTRATAFGCMKITNKGSTDERLISVVIGPNDTTRLIEVKNGKNTSSRTKTAGTILIPAGRTVHLHPDSPYIALIKVASPYSEGGVVSGSLVFEKAGAVSIDYEVGD